MDSSMKQTNRCQIRMNSIRQIVNLQWIKFANIYSKFLIRFSWSILSFGLLITAGLTACFFLLVEVRQFDQQDFFMPKGLTMTNAQRIKMLFGNDTELRMHQQLNLYPGLDIIIKRKVNNNETSDNQTNMLDDQTVEEIKMLDQQLQSILINDTKNNVEHNYSSLCTKMNSACIVDGNYVLSRKFREEMFHLHPPKYGYYMDTSGANGVPGFMFGKKYGYADRAPVVSDDSDYNDVDEEAQQHELENSTKIVSPSTERIIVYVPLFRIRYSLNSSTPEIRKLAIDWERKALSYLNGEYKSKLIDVFPSTSTAISDAITKTAHEEGIYITFMFLIFFVLLCIFLSIQGNVYTSVGYLPLCGIISICLSTGATFGLLSVCRIKIIEPMALLIFIVAIIDAMRCSIVCGEYHRIIIEHMDTSPDESPEIDIEKLLPSIITSTHPYFIVSTLIISFVYLLFSICSPMSLTMPICLTLALYIFINYIVHSTFFTSCLVITLKRVSSRRHCLCCCRLPKDNYTKANRKSKRLNVLRNQIYSLLNIDSMWKKPFASIFCLLLIVFIILSLWFGLSIDTSLFEDKYLPREFYSLRSHMQSQADDFEMGPVIMFTIPEAIDYNNAYTQEAMRNLLEQCVSETRTNTFKLLWLDNENIAEITTGKDNLNYRITPFSKNDLIVSEGQNFSTIQASRFYCQYNSIKGDREDIRTMNVMYTYAKQSRLPSIFPYSLLFPSYESLGQLRIEVCVLILALILCCFITTFIAFISLKNSLFIVAHFLALSAGTLACLYLFQNLTYNFVVGPWLYLVPILYVDTLIHVCYSRTDSKWKYNRVILSLLIAVFVLYLFPIQTYAFQIICSSIIYQSIICFVLINLILPSWFYLFQSNNNNDNNNDNNDDNNSEDQIDTVVSPTMTIVVPNNSLKGGMEINNHTDESNINTNDPI
ncbi:unnamed protein product [Rotaria magnacalcarata]|uniref:SSD domain-containing protein n=11 Tax=Rotaria magnacalcarata TaxID=392030 RepID=A0A816CDH2_9BILA|nr:unnamed protein product [Rotaria magnacalcarata]CAF2258922.1 unnamed protein product [Rotaria magnacalcarata]